ncbi:11631_t:CDS:1, partial [Gigaspora margarita]
NLVLNMPSTLSKQRSQVLASRLTNLSALLSLKILELTLQLTDPLTLSIPEALAPTIQIASYPTLSSLEILKQKPLVNSNLRRPLQLVSNNYVKTQELNEIIKIQESQKEFFQRNLFTNSNIIFHIHNHYHNS